MDNLLFKFDQATDLENDQNNSSSTRFNILYKNNDKLIKKQQQRRNEILSNRLCKRDKLIASIRRLVSDVNEEATSINNAAADDTDDLDCDADLCDDLNENKSKSFVSEDNNNRFDDDSDDLVFSELPSQSTTTITTNSHHLHHHHHNANPNLHEQQQQHNNNNSFASLNNHHATTKQATNNNNKTPPSQQTAEDKKFRNKAMLSEWLVDKPQDFEIEWVLKATPVGRRCLVFARKGETVAYSRTGQFIRAFQSNLPGGCRSNTAHCRRQFAIVDCIYVHSRNSFYMMDALAWNEHKLYESEASLRFFWLQSRYNEAQEKFQLLNSRNESIFYCLNTYRASNQDILTALNNDPLIREHNLQLDGLLFFHIRGPYVPGSNPLVLWIKPDMVNRVLDLNSTSK